MAGQKNKYFNKFFSFLILKKKISKMLNTYNAIQKMYIQMI